LAQNWSAEVTLPESVEIAGHIIQQGGRAFIIAEVAQAHDGSLGFAHSFIDIAAEAGADAIKFQTHIAEAESTKDEQFRVNFSYEDKTRFEYWKRMEFTASQWEGLAKHAREKGVVFLSSCFSVEAVEMLRGVSMPAWKVGSGEIASRELLEAMAIGGEPILLSTGMSGLTEIESQLAALKRRNVPVALMQCTTKYPSPLEEVGLNVIDELHDRFGCPVGLSDHSGLLWPSVAAIARGAALIEVHIALHRRQFGPDTAASLDPAVLRELCEARDAIAKMLANPVDKSAASERLRSVREIFGKSLALKQALPAGTVLAAEHLTFKKPGGGLSRQNLPSLIGRTLVREVPADRLLRADDLDPGPQSKLEKA
jgi:N,N'-diacetyllegionaminate synthase